MQKENRRGGSKESTAKSCVALPESYFNRFFHQIKCYGRMLLQNKPLAIRSRKTVIPLQQEKSQCPVIQPLLTLEAEHNTCNFIQISAVSRQ